MGASKKKKEPKGNFEVSKYRKSQIYNLAVNSLRLFVYINEGAMDGVEKVQFETFIKSAERILSPRLKKSI